ncbi:MAG: substrate-binding domain-containing protein [Armatimonadota bacterium]|nr:substrate-binding domain-containing protein [Armatimonadota bacterium]MDR7434276.1 substrate-binding domain-containing protein [Armatimonadota bacterium]
MSIRKLASVVICVGLFLALAAPGSVAPKPVKAAVFVSSLAHPFFVDMVDGAKAAGKKFAVEVISYDARNDVEQQTRQVEDAIAAKVDAILLNPITAEGLVAAVKKANAAKIPVFTLDRDVVGGDRIAYIGTDNVKAAMEGAKKLIELLQAAKKKKPWRIVVLEGTPGASSAIERGQGFKNVLDPLKKAKEVDIVADLTAKFDRATGLKVMEDILGTTKDIHGVIAANDEMALGALEALKAAGLKVGFPDGVIIVGFDAIKDAVEAVKRGEFAATVAQAPYIMGYWGVEAAARHIREGWKPPKGTPVYKPTGALLIGTPTMVVTKENVGQVDKVTKTPPKLPGTK